MPPLRAAPQAEAHHTRARRTTAPQRARSRRAKRGSFPRSLRRSRRTSRLHKELEARSIRARKQLAAAASLSSSSSSEVASQRAPLNHHTFAARRFPTRMRSFRRDRMLEALRATRAVVVVVVRTIRAHQDRTTSPAAVKARPTWKRAAAAANLNSPAPSARTWPLPCD